MKETIILIVFGFAMSVIIVVTNGFHFITQARYLKRLEDKLDALIKDKK